jgi:hypothetical protein
VEELNLPFFDLKSNFPFPDGILIAGITKFASKHPLDLEMDGRISNLLLSKSKTRVFKSPLIYGFSNVGDLISPSTFNEIHPLFILFSSELEELQLDFPFFNPI